MELSIQFDFMRYKSGKVSELEAVLNTEGLRGMMNRGVSRTINERLEGINIYIGSGKFCWG